MCKAAGGIRSSSETLDILAGTGFGGVNSRRNAVCAIMCRQGRFEQSWFEVGFIRFWCKRF